MIYSFTSETSILGLLETLNDRIRGSSELLAYEDVFPKVRSTGEYQKDGKANIDLHMADGDFFEPIMRIDLLERDGLPLPHTREVLAELAGRYHKPDFGDEGDPDSGLCIYPLTGSGLHFNFFPQGDVLWLTETVSSSLLTEGRGDNDISLSAAREIFSILQIPPTD